MHSLFPEITPFNSEYIELTPVDGVRHALYIEQCGNKNGIPVIFLHGGPGSGCNANHRRFFDAKRYHIILFDQRGAGRSLPLGDLSQNNTDNLLADIELIRQHLAIEKWLVFGGSWGSTLALLYAKKHSENILGLILRGIFLARPQDTDWVYSHKGAAKFYPERWQQLCYGLKQITKNNQPQSCDIDNSLNEQAQTQLSELNLNDLFAAINAQDNNTSQSLLALLQAWESSLMSLPSDDQQTIIINNAQTSTSVSTSKTPLINSKTAIPEISAQAKAASIIQLYYTINQCFLDQPLLSQIEPLKHLPITIIHGRYDMVCPVEQAYCLKQALPNASLTIVEQAGHIATEPGILSALIDATNCFADNFHMKTM